MSLAGVSEFFVGNGAIIHDLAQRALDKYDGYVVHTQLLNATDELYELRNKGIADPSLAIASHYLHCRYGGCMTGLLPPAFGVGTVMTIVYDGGVKGLETLVKKVLGSAGYVPKFGKAPTSDFSIGMLAWDARGLIDGHQDAIYRWGKCKLTAARFPVSLPWVSTVLPW